MKIGSTDTTKEVKIEEDPSEITDKSYESSSSELSEILPEHDERKEYITRLGSADLTKRKPTIYNFDALEEISTER